MTNSVLWYKYYSTLIEVLTKPNIKQKQDGKETDYTHF